MGSPHLAADFSAARHLSDRFVSVTSNHGKPSSLPTRHASCELDSEEQAGNTISLTGVEMVFRAPCLVIMLSMQAWASNNMRPYSHLPVASRSSCDWTRRFSVACGLVPCKSQRRHPRRLLPDAPSQPEILRPAGPSPHDSHQPRPHTSREPLPACFERECA